MRFPRALAASALTLGLIAVGAPAAQADPTPAPVDYSACQFTDGELSNPVLVVGTKKVRSVSAGVTGSNCGTFTGDNDTNAQGENLTLTFGDDPTGYRNMPFTFLRSSLGDPTYYFGDAEADPGDLSNDVAGKKLTGVIGLPDGTTRPFPGPQLTLKREARFDNGGLPDKVKKNKSFYVGGFIYRADWDEDSYVGIEHTKVHLQSRPSGGKWKTVKTVTSGRGVQGGGTYAHVKVKKATCFRWVYDGSSTTASVTSARDCVKIK